MKPLSKACWLVLLIAVAFSLQASAFQQAIDTAAIDAVVQDTMRAWDVPGASLAIVKDDRVIYLKGFGVRELGSQQPVTPDTLFAIASTTKAFTTTAMAMLVDEGKINWDDPVRKHLEFFRLADPLASENVTLRDLVCHRTGLSRNDLLWEESPWGREEILRRIGWVKLNRPFRSTYQYNNIMFLAAGEVVGRTSGGSWESFIQSRIFDPLGMSTANFSITQVLKSSDHSSPHRKNKAGKVEAISWVNVDNIGGAGCINASARDMSRWVRFQLGDGIFEGKRLVSSTNLAETHTPQMVIRMDDQAMALNPYTTQVTYGMGWIIQDYHGQTLISHTGGLNGFRARVVLVPRVKLGMAILTNSSVGSSGASMHTAATNSLLDLLLGFQKTDWNSLLAEQARKVEAAEKARLDERETKRQKETHTSHDLAAYIGTYLEPAYGTVTVSLADGSLLLQWSSFEAKLDHFHFDAFSVEGPSLLENEQVVFTQGRDGDIAGLNFLGLEFVKQPSPVYRSGQSK
ncbi:MAG TPA: serine hydrolase [Acidobacteriota bacterium]